MLYTGLIFTLPALADEAQFTNKDFLQLPDAHKKFWIQGAMLAMSSVAGQKTQNKGKCIVDWYFGDKKSERNGLILATMQKYPSHKPSAVFIVLIERNCGKFYQ